MPITILNFHNYSNIIVFVRRDVTHAKVMKSARLIDNFFRCR